MKIMGTQYKSETPSGLIKEVRTDLNSEYCFGDSHFGVYTFDREAIKQELPADFRRIMEAAKFTDENIAEQIRKYSEGRNATCFHTRKEIGDYDYIVAVSLPVGSDIELASHLGEEVAHGEHRVEHTSEDGNYNFSGVASEFFGMSGRCCISDRIIRFRNKRKLPGIRINMGIPNSDYNTKDGVLDIDLAHIAGYNALLQCLGKVEIRELFHEPDERRMWEKYNEGVIPNIPINVPVEWVGDRGEISESACEILDNIGLECNVVMVNS